MGRFNSVAAILAVLVILVVLRGFLCGPAAGPPAGDPDINPAVVPATHLASDPAGWFARHEDVLRLGRKGPWDLVFIGDSITQFFGGSPRSPVARGRAVWEEYYGRRRALNLGFGWDRTQNVLWRLQNGELDGVAPKAAVILIGTNNLSTIRSTRRNTPDQIAAGVAAVCAEIAVRAPGCRLLLVGLLPRRSESLVPELREVNRLLSGLAAREGIVFLDPWDRFAGPDGMPRPELMNDAIHPNEAGYRAWAELMEPLLARWLAAAAPGRE